MRAGPSLPRALALALAPMQVSRKDARPRDEYDDMACAEDAARRASVEHELAGRGLTRGVRRMLIGSELLTLWTVREGWRPSARA